MAQEIKIFSCQPFFNDSSGELSISSITNTQKIKKIYSPWFKFEKTLKMEL